MELVTDRRLREAIPLFTAMAGVVLVVSICALLMLGREVLIPLALATLLTFALAPVCTAIERFGFKRGAAVSITVISVVCLLLVLAYVLFVQTSDLASQLPTYRTIIRDKLQTLAGGMGASGPFSRAMEISAELARELGGTRSALPANAQVVVVATPASGGMSMLAAAAGPTTAVLAKAGAVILLTAFMLLQREDLRNRVIRLMGADDIQSATALLDDAGSRLGRLLLAQLLVNIAFGAAVGIGLWFIGLPNPFLWGFIAGALRYIPFVGTIIGLVPPFLIAFAVDPTWWSLIMTAIFIAIIEFLVAHVIEPMVYARRTGLSPFAVVLAVTIWAFLWGLTGLVLALPLTICLVALGRHVPALNFLEILLGDRPALPPQDILYQRLLTGDAAGAARHAEMILNDQALPTYYDNVMLPGLRRALSDVTRGNVSGDRLERLVAAAKAVITTLKSRKNRRSQPVRLSAEATALLEHVSGAKPIRAIAVPREHRHRIGIAHNTHPLDIVAAVMLAHALSVQGHAVDVQPMAADLTGSTSIPEVIVLSYVEPLSVVHMRAACIAARRAAPAAKIVIVVWQEMTIERRMMLGKKLRVDAMAHSVNEAIVGIESLAV